jgi:hypothetical protein
MNQAADITGIAPVAEIRHDSKIQGRWCDSLAQVIICQIELGALVAYAGGIHFNRYELL